jgi:two-component system, chemotaxis family, sensor histidine kinase and response regulator WspE
VSKPERNDPTTLSMLELFRIEAENQTALLTSGLLELERGSSEPGPLEMLMRAAHSFKGAARIVNLAAAVRVAHALEDCFALAQQGTLVLRQPEIDVLFRGIDLLLQISKQTEASITRWESDHAAAVEEFVRSLANLGQTGGSATTPQPAELSPATTEPAPPAAHSQAIATRSHETPERVVRLTAENLNRLLGLAGESLVESRWLRPFADSLQRLKRHQTELAERLDDLRQRFGEEKGSARTEHRLGELVRTVAGCQQILADRLQELDLFDRRSAQLSQRMYLEVLRTRMRPFSDGVRRFPRMVRDLARTLGKKVRLEIIGENTQVDRDILERLESPLAHLLRNAVDHGCEPPELRERAGKVPEGVIRLEARHSAGMLLITVADDGCGVDAKRVREAIVKRKRRHVADHGRGRRLRR